MTLTKVNAEVILGLTLVRFITEPTLSKVNEIVVDLDVDFGLDQTSLEYCMKNFKT